MRWSYPTFSTAGEAVHIYYSGGGYSKQDWGSAILPSIHMPCSLFWWRVRWDVIWIWMPRIERGSVPCSASYLSMYGNLCRHMCIYLAPYQYVFICEYREQSLIPKLLSQNETQYTLYCYSSCSSICLGFRWLGSRPFYHLVPSWTWRWYVSLKKQPK